MKMPAIQVDEQKRAHVVGELTLKYVPRFWILGCQIIKQYPSPVFDLKAVKVIDSSCLALLTAWSRYAYQRKKTINLLHVPQKLQTISELSGVDSILAQWIN